MKYCFAIVTFKRCELLGKLLDSIYCQKGVFDYSVVVWDNDPLGSAYDTVAKYKHAVYIRSDKNLGGSGGFYSVFSESVKYDWDYLISADDDIEFTCDFLQIIEASIRRYQNSVILPQRIYSVDGSDYTWGPKLKKNSVSRISYHLKNTNEDSEVDLITFEGCVYPRNVILSVGFPDPLFYIDGDDWEYGVRIRKQNYSIIRTANKLIKRNIKPHQDISVCNIAGIKFKSLRSGLTSQRTYYEVRNKLYIIKKYSSNRIFEISVYLIKQIKRLLGSLFFEKDRFQYFSAVLIAVYHGLHNIRGEFVLRKQ